MFEAFGPLKFLEIKTEDDGISRGFGFVQYYSSIIFAFILCSYMKVEDGKAALGALNGLEVAGKPMKVSLSQV